jgi:hypothetical protein
MGRPSDVCRSGDCGACTRCYPAQVAEYDYWQEVRLKDEVELDRIEERIARLDAMPVESQTYADLAWYEWAWKRASFLYDELFPAIEEHDYGGW